MDLFHDSHTERQLRSKTMVIRGSLLIQAEELLEDINQHKFEVAADSKTESHEVLADLALVTKKLQAVHNLVEQREALEMNQAARADLLKDVFDPYWRLEAAASTQLSTDEPKDYTAVETKFAAKWFQKEIKRLKKDLWDLLQVHCIHALLSQKKVIVEAGLRSRKANAHAPKQQAYLDYGCREVVLTSLRALTSAATAAKSAVDGLAEESARYVSAAKEAATVAKQSCERLDRQSKRLQPLHPLDESTRERLNYAEQSTNAARIGSIIGERSVASLSNMVSIDGVDIRRLDLLNELESFLKACDQMQDAILEVDLLNRNASATVHAAALIIHMAQYHLLSPSVAVKASHSALAAIKVAQQSLEVIAAARAGERENAFTAAKRAKDEATRCTNAASQVVTQSNSDRVMQAIKYMIRDYMAYVIDQAPRPSTAEKTRTPTKARSQISEKQRWPDTADTSEKSRVKPTPTQETWTEILRAGAGFIAHIHDVVDFARAEAKSAAMAGAKHEEVAEVVDKIRVQFKKAHDRGNTDLIRGMEHLLRSTSIYMRELVKCLPGAVESNKAVETVTTGRHRVDKTVETVKESQALRNCLRNLGIFASEVLGEDLRKRIQQLLQDKKTDWTTTLRISVTRVDYFDDLASQQKNSLKGIPKKLLSITREYCLDVMIDGAQKSDLTADKRATQAKRILGLMLTPLMNLADAPYFRLSDHGGNINNTPSKTTNLPPAPPLSEKSQDLIIVEIPAASSDPKPSSSRYLTSSTAKTEPVAFENIQKASDWLTNAFRLGASMHPDSEIVYQIILETLHTLYISIRRTSSNENLAELFDQIDASDLMDRGTRDVSSDLVKRIPFGYTKAFVDLKQTAGLLEQTLKDAENYDRRSQKQSLKNDQQSQKQILKTLQRIAPKLDSDYGCQTAEKVKEAAELAQKTASEASNMAQMIRRVAKTRVTHSAKETNSSNLFPVELEAAIKAVDAAHSRAAVALSDTAKQLVNLVDSTVGFARDVLDKAGRPNSLSTEPTDLDSNKQERSNKVGPRIQGDSEDEGDVDREVASDNEAAKDSESFVTALKQKIVRAKAVFETLDHKSRPPNSRHSGAKKDWMKNAGIKLLGALETSSKVAQQLLEAARKSLENYLEDSEYDLNSALQGLDSANKRATTAFLLVKKFLDEKPNDRVIYNNLEQACLHTIEIPQMTQIIVSAIGTLQSAHEVVPIRLSMADVLPIAVPIAAFNEIAKVRRSVGETLDNIRAPLNVHIAKPSWFVGLRGVHDENIEFSIYHGYMRVKSENFSDPVWDAIKKYFESVKSAYILSNIIFFRLRNLNHTIVEQDWFHEFTDHVLSGVRVSVRCYVPEEGIHHHFDGSTRCRNVWSEAKRYFDQMVIRRGQDINGITALSLVMKLRNHQQAFVRCFFRNPEGVARDIRHEGLARILGPYVIKHILKEIFRRMRREREDSDYRVRLQSVAANLIAGTLRGEEKSSFLHDTGKPFAVDLEMIYGFLAEVEGAETDLTLHATRLGVIFGGLFAFSMDVKLGNNKNVQSLQSGIDAGSKVLSATVQVVPVVAPVAPAVTAAVEACAEIIRLRVDAKKKKLNERTKRFAVNVVECFQRALPSMPVKPPAKPKTTIPESVQHDSTEIQISRPVYIPGYYKIPTPDDCNRYIQIAANVFHRVSRDINSVQVPWEGSGSKDPKPSKESDNKAKEK